MNKAKGFIYNKNISSFGLAVKNISSLYDIPYKNVSENQNSIYIRSNFHIITAIPDYIWKLLPIQSHEIKKPDKHFITDFNKAIDLLEDHFAEWHILKKYLGGICLLSLNPEFKNKDVEITSVSLPIFPFISFVSKKSFFHIPPKIIKNPSILYLSENLLHESVHQSVNLYLIEKEVLGKKYNSKHSPLISIPWRKNQSIARNKEWKIDRALHAVCVYSVVASFRRKMLKNNKSEYSISDFSSAVKNAEYLITELIKHRKIFKEHKILDILKDDINFLKESPLH